MRARVDFAALDSQLVEKQNAEGGFPQPGGKRIKLDVKDVMMSSWRRSGVRALLKCKDGNVYVAMYQGRWSSLKVFRLYAENEENPLDDAQTDDCAGVVLCLPRCHRAAR